MLCDVYLKKLHLSVHLYPLVLRRDEEGVAGCEVLLLAVGPYMALALQSYQDDEAVQAGSLHVDGRVDVVDAGGEVSAVHQPHWHVLARCVGRAVVRQDGVVDGLGGLLGVQLPIVAVLVAPLEVVDAIGDIARLLNLGQEAAGPDGMDMP